ncbi:MAG: GDSL-type esterase/lipase family protein [Pseudomonadota bacterium]
MLAAAWPLITQSAPEPAPQGVPRTDANSLLAHQQLLQKARTGRIDLYFLGDSITRRWGATDYPQLLQHWNASFNGWNAGNFGWGGDTVLNILWRIENGELNGVNPRVIVLMAGTNDVGNLPPSAAVGAASVAISENIGALLAAVRARAPRATIILMGILPREDNPAAMPVIADINQRLAHFAGRRVRYLNINARFVDAQGHLKPGVMMDGKLHPALPGYRIWAEELEPYLIQLLGPRAKQDLAPPPTGDPAQR